MATNDKTLCYLDKFPDYKVASDDCDVRGLGSERQRQPQHRQSGRTTGE